MRVDDKQTLRNSKAVRVALEQITERIIDPFMRAVFTGYLNQQLNECLATVAKLDYQGHRDLANTTWNNFPSPMRLFRNFCTLHVRGIMAVAFRGLSRDEKVALSNNIDATIKRLLR